jgi:hypothetical protein
MPLIALFSTVLSGCPDPRKQAETPCFASFKHWSCIKLINGEITTTTFPVNIAGIWKHKDFPAQR